MRDFVGAGLMLEKIEILSFTQATEGEYTWEKAADSWGQITPQAARSLYSVNGLAASGVRIFLRKRSLNLNQAIRWKGQHCFLTSIREENRQYLEVTAALVDLVDCRAYRGLAAYDEYNRPLPTEPRLISSFPAVLTEKYLRHSQEEPMAVVDICYVLVTPKAIELRTGDLIEIADKRYQLLLCHTLDPHKNEYELLREEEP